MSAQITSQQVSPEIGFLCDELFPVGRVYSAFGPNISHSEVGFSIHQMCKWRL